MTDAPSSSETRSNQPVGVWIIGALGDVATTTVLGALAIGRGLAPSVGMVTARAPFDDLGLVEPVRLVFGGHDVREGSPLEVARGLAARGVVPTALVEACQDGLLAYGERVRSGVVYGAGEVVSKLESNAARARRADGPRSALAALREDVRAFRAAHDLARVVVIHLASTEPKQEAPSALDSAAGIQALLDEGGSLPASVLYALAAIEEGCPYVNFTPSLGAGSAGLRELAKQRGVPHMGCDGKTGQTLMRTALAPMFAARNFNVLSWSGFNILGNRDGEVLDEPAANAAKTEGKDSVLGRILGDQLGTSLTKIDYVPSLNDWKTAWDFVHFEGFLGTRMQLQFTWHGADSALAAPLVLDLIRLLDAAARAGRKGLQTGLACFFKTPHGVEEYSFPKQTSMLEAYAEELRQVPKT